MASIAMLTLFGCTHHDVEKHDGARVASARDAETSRRPDSPTVGAESVTNSAQILYFDDVVSDPQFEAGAASSGTFIDRVGRLALPKTGGLRTKQWSQYLELADELVSMDVADVRTLIAECKRLDEARVREGPRHQTALFLLFRVALQSTDGPPEGMDWPLGWILWSPEPPHRGAPPTDFVLTPLVVEDGEMRIGVALLSGGIGSTPKRPAPAPYDAAADFDWLRSRYDAWQSR